MEEKPIENTKAERMNPVFQLETGKKPAKPGNLTIIATDSAEDDPRGIESETNKTRCDCRTKDCCDDETANEFFGRGIGVIDSFQKDHGG